MRICVLGSGSSGNTTYFETKRLKILIDFGTTTLYTTSKLEEIGVKPNGINAIFITHDHVDHINGLKVFLKKNTPTLYLTKPIYDELKKSINIEKYVLLNETTYFEDLKVTTIKTSHDATDGVGFIFESNHKSFVYITDTGYINIKYHHLLLDKDIYVIESNHDVKMLMEGTYPYHIKQRILGDYGHLSNNTCSKYLESFVGNKTKYIFLAHLSEQNNTKELALIETKEALKDKNIEIIITQQHDKTVLVEV